MFDGAKPLTMLLFGGAGYFLSDMIDGSGLGITLYQRVPFIRTLIDNAYQQKGYSKSFGQTISKAAAIPALLYSLYQSKNGATSKVINTTLPLTLGLAIDDPSAGYSSSGSTQGYWNN